MLTLRTYLRDIPVVLPPVLAGLLFAVVLSAVSGYRPRPTMLACVGGAAVGTLAHIWFNPAAKG